MASIGELSDRPQFHIKTVSTRTGIRPVTLRAWERRYKLLKPRRTSGNYRLYSEREVALLRWLKLRVDNGVPISAAITEFREFRRRGRWPEALPRLRARATGRAPNPPAAYARRLYRALTQLDEAQAGAILQEAHSLFDLTAVCLEVITPCLVEVGEAWHRGAIRIATEHFASTYLRGRLLSLFQAYPTYPGAPRVIVGCAPMERHEIGALMLALLLRREGYRVEYLGPDVYIEDLIDYAKVERPAMICLSASAEVTARELIPVQAGLAASRPRPKFGFGGRAFNLQPELRSAVPGEFLGETADEACQNIRRLIAV